MPATPVPPELKSIAPFLQRAEEMRSKDPVISCEYYAVKRGLSLKLSSEARPFLFQLMDSLEATKKALRDQEAITNDEVAHLYVENFADRIFIMADEEDRRGATSRSTAKKFLAAGQFFDLLAAFDGGKLTQGPKTSEKRTYAKWRAAEISKAFRDGRTPPPPPEPIAPSNPQAPTSPTPTDPSASQTLTASSITLPSLDASTSTLSPGHSHSRIQSSQSPPPVTTSFVITSPNGNGPGSGTSRRRASDVSASTPTRSAGGSSPSWSSRVHPTFETANGRPGSAETSPAREKRARRGPSTLGSRAAPGVEEEDSGTDPGTDDEEGGAGGRAGRGRINPVENGHEAGGEGQSSVWDSRQASMVTQPPDSRHQSFAQRPGESGLPFAAPEITSPPVVSPVPHVHVHGHPPISPTATSPPGINGPPVLIYGQPDSVPSPQPGSKQTSPKSAQPSVKQTSPRAYYATPGRTTPPGVPPPSSGSTTATPVSSHASVTSVSTPTSSPAPASDSPASTVNGTTAPTTALVLPPRRVHFSGSTVGGMSSVASSPESSPETTPTSLPDPNILQITGPPQISPTHSRRYEPTPRAPAALLPPPDADSVLPPLSNALVRPQSYQVNRAALSNVAYPTASAPPYPEPTYVPPPTLVHHHGHSPSAQPSAIVHVPQSTYPYAPATPHAPSPPLPATISGPATQRAQKHAKFAISALDYDDLETARKELMNALAIVNGRSAL